MANKICSFMFSMHVNFLTKLMFHSFDVRTAYIVCVPNNSKIENVSLRGFYHYTIHTHI